MALLATWAGLPALVRDPRRGRRLLRWLGLGRLPLARNILLPQPLTRAQSSSAVAPVGEGSGEGAEPNGVAEGNKSLYLWSLWGCTCSPVWGCNISFFCSTH